VEYVAKIWELGGGQSYVGKRRSHIRIEHLDDVGGRGRGGIIRGMRENAGCSALSAWLIFQTNDNPL